jgi:thymidine phosphorylase
MLSMLSSECEKRYGRRGKSVWGCGLKLAPADFGLYTLRQGNASSKCVVAKYQV